MNIPDTWITTTFAEVIDKIKNGANVPQNKSGDGARLTRIETIATGKINPDRVGYTVSIIPNDLYLLKNGDVLFSHINSGKHLGKTAIYNDEIGPIYHGINLLRIQVKRDVTTSEFFSYNCKKLRDEGKFINRANHAVNQSSLNQKHINAFSYILPPLEEQRRIVKKIDSLSAKSNRARDNLDRGISLVARYKEALISSVLSDLKVPKKAKLAQVCRVISDGDHQAPPKSEGGIPFITISALNDGLIRLDKATRHVPLSYYNGLKPARIPQSGDVLFSVTGSIGLSALVESDDPFVFQRHIAILKPNPSIIRNEFLLINLRSMSIKRQMLACATGTAQLTVPLSGLRSFSIPLPSLQEQDLAVARIKTAFAWVDRLTTEAASAHKLIDHLDQAVLSKAFRGELVPQDPDDEPAGMLLERIKAEQAGTTPARRGRGRPRLATTT